MSNEREAVEAMWADAWKVAHGEQEDIDWPWRGRLDDQLLRETVVGEVLALCRAERDAGRRERDREMAAAAVLCGVYWDIAEGAGISPEVISAKRDAALASPEAMEKMHRELARLAGESAP